MTWDQLRHLHRDPQVIALWRRLFGPLLRWLQPNRRRWILASGALIVALRQPIAALLTAPDMIGAWQPPQGGLLVAALMMLFVLVCYFVAKKFSSLPGFVRRRPVIHLHAGFWLLLIVTWNASQATPASVAVLAGCATAMPLLLWRLSYLLQSAQRGKVQGTGFRDHALYIWPVWGGSDTPYGKGLDYLSSVEARDEDSLARSQLAGLKLFVLAALCSAGNKLVGALVFGSANIFGQLLGGATLGVPTVKALMIAAPATYPAWMGWAAMYGDLFQQVLKLGAYGHVVVGYLRLSGFHAFRNTYKPLLAETIVEFWNRYYYYFKELLVNHFFLPTFSRYFRGHPRLRLFAAVFAAAFLGNLYYHLIQAEALVRGDWPALANLLGPRAFYCFLLAAGICVSMLREQRRSAPPGNRPWPRRLAAILGVWTYFAVIRLWHDGGPPFAARWDYLAGLAGIN